MSQVNQKQRLAASSRQPGFSGGGQQRTGRCFVLGQLRAQGVGPKLAGRIVNELKDKAGAMPGGSGGFAVSAAAAPAGSKGADAASALENLGFKPAVAAQAVARALEELGEGASEGDLIRVALKKAAG